VSKLSEIGRRIDSPSIREENALLRSLGWILVFIKNRTEMACHIRISKHRSLARALLLAALFVCGFGLSDATASSISTSDRRAEEDHADYCKCRHCRKDSCCCGPRKSRPSPAAPAQDSDSDPELPTTSSGPCMSSVPCGDAGLPTSPSMGPFGKVAAQALCAGCFPTTADRLTPPHSCLILPARRAARLDEPPERLTVA